VFPQPASCYILHITDTDRIPEKPHAARFSSDNSNGSSSGNGNNALSGNGARHNASKEIPMKNRITIPLLLVAALLLSACASSSGDTYSPDQARMEQTVTYGVITGIAPVTIQSDQTGLGTLGGAVAGGVVGSTIGGGSGRILSAVGGAIVGAVAGGMGESALRKHDGLEITVQKDSGETVVIVQEADKEPLAKGDRVRILKAQDGSTRVRPLP
jgi:outer membrane lipoprotein SlyB